MVLETFQKGTVLPILCQKQLEKCKNISCFKPVKGGQYFLTHSWSASSKGKVLLPLFPLAHDDKKEKTSNNDYTPPLGHTLFTVSFT